jgi:hypothetical protein
MMLRFVRTRDSWSAKCSAIDAGHFCCMLGLLSPIALASMAKATAEPEVQDLKQEISEDLESQKEEQEQPTPSYWFNYYTGQTESVETLPQIDDESSDEDCVQAIKKLFAPRDCEGIEPIYTALRAKWGIKPCQAFELIKVVVHQVYTLQQLELEPQGS